MNSPTRPSASDARLDPARLEEFVSLNAGLTQPDITVARRAALQTILSGCAALRAEGASELLRGLPPLIGRAMVEHGWSWNGFYALHSSGELRLGFAHGPPVCSPLERQGGPLTSGMCFDAIALNQTLAAPDVKAWPGYVSCDGASGLATVSGIVCPVRGAHGRPVAVWDLDATQRIEEVDVRFFDVLFATLACCFELRYGDFGAPD